MSEVLRNSRPLTPEDLVAEDRASDAEAADQLADDAIDRATAARDALQSRTTALAPLLAAAVAAADDTLLDLTPLRAAMRALAAAGIAAAFPLNARGDTLEQRRALIAQGASAQAEAARRLTRAGPRLTEAAAPEHAGNPAFRLEVAREVAGFVLGGGLPFLPRFRFQTARAAELANALTHSTDPAFIGTSVAARDREVRRFEMTAARVRPALDAWRRLELYTTTLGVVPASRAVAQLPYVAGARWVGLPFATEAERPPSGRTSVLLARVAEPAATAAWAGLLLDPWTEVIPAPTEQTGVAFHYDDPSAEAPQAILLAVPPVHAEQWDLASLVATLHETLDLAKVRAVDSELLGPLAQLLPAIFLAESTSSVTVQTKFADSVRGERTIAFRPEE